MWIMKPAKLVYLIIDKRSLSVGNVSCSLEIAFQVIESKGHVLNLPTVVGNLDALDSSTVTVNLML